METTHTLYKDACILSKLIADIESGWYKTPPVSVSFVEGYSGNKTVRLVRMVFSSNDVIDRMPTVFLEDNYPETKWDGEYAHKEALIHIRITDAFLSWLDNTFEFRATVMLTDLKAFLPSTRQITIDEILADLA